MGGSSIYSWGGGGGGGGHKWMLVLANKGNIKYNLLAESNVVHVFVNFSCKRKGIEF